MEERSLGTKGKTSKQDLTRVKELTIELPEGRESPYHRLYQLTNLTYSLIYDPEKTTYAYYWNKLTGKEL